MVSLAGRQEARTSAKVPRANQTRCVGQPRIRARALTLGNLGRTSTQGTGTPQTPFHRVFWPPRLLRARVDWKSGETGEGG